jgi:hypothetical protein
MPDRCDPGFHLSSDEARAGSQSSVSTTIRRPAAESPWVGSLRPPMPRIEPFLRLLCAALGLMSVASLLAWGYRLGSFATWFRLLSAPAMVVLLIVGCIVSRRHGAGTIRASMVAGTIGGLVGTIAYDVVRVPELAFGLRPYLPIDSYGLLVLGASHSSPLTDAAGWAFNLANGIGFGITYAMLARGRPWWWAVPYALALETAFVVTPLAQIYQLSGQWTLIGLAYVAHLFYAYPLGRIVASTEAFVRELDGLSRHAAPVALLALVVALVAWHRPFSTPSEMRAALALSEGTGDGALIVSDRLVPEWLRVPPGGCARVRNDDPTAHRLSGARGTPDIEPGRVARVCFDGAGVVRVRTSARPFAGGLVLVDPEMRGNR